ncbi:MAG: hypothetical protein IKR68_08765 [Lachnospiraceae bacterium]|nr:hypothetical protein [Lachnospiraceae bacterium]
MKTDVMYILNQALVITMLFITGLAFERMVEEVTIRLQNIRYSSKLVKLAKGSVKRSMWRLMLAYPTGLALWGVMGFILLVFKIPFGRVTMFLSYMLIFSILGYFYLDTKKNFNFEKTRFKHQLITAFVVFLLALICCSGLFRISISNDSYYYYSLYPQTLAIEGGYIRSFDVFLTDVGQISAIIGTLPWFFGFEETVGIQLFLSFNLVGLYCLGVYEMGFMRMPGKADIGIGKRRITNAISVLSSLMLMAASPFFVLTRWILANAYFMTYFFIAFLLTIKLAEKEYVTGRRDRVLLTIYIATLSMLRMEGGMFACLLVLCACSLDLSDRILLQNYVLPVALTQILYYSAVYLELRVDPLYSFLSLTNVFIMLAVLAAVAVYIRFFRGKRLLTIQKHYTWVLLGGLALGNLVIAVISPERYMGNLGFFVQNIVHQNGWGPFGVLIPAALLLLPVGLDLREEIEFPVLFTLGYVLFTVALCWARNGTLRVGIGDSGNRVLMQIAPFVIYTLTGLLIERSNGKQEQQ